jgi:probable addiction module antidote protein
VTKPDVTPYDVVEYFRDETDMLAYIDAALQDGEASIIAHALGDVARGKGMTEIARQCGLGRESLYKSLSKQGNPELATVLKVLKALGMRLRVEAITE